MKTKQLAIQPLETVNKAVVPKPTKAEVIEAMAQVRAEEMRAENRQIQEKCEKVKKSLSAKIIKHLNKTKASLTPEVGLGYMCGNGLKRVSVEYKLDNLTPELERELIAYHDMDTASYVDISQIRKEVRSAMMGGANVRIDALVNNPETKKALSNLLKEVGVSPKIEAIEV